MNHSNQPSSPSRRLILAFGGLLLLWPLIRFIAHKLPRKPKIIETTGTLQNDIFLSKQDFIVFTENTELWAVSRTCTHLGCRLNYIEEHNYLECPCHQSRFSIDGEVIKGPADKPLPRYLVERTDSPSTYLVTIT